MALLDVVQTGEEEIGDLRSELDRVRQALDRTDAILDFADDALEKAETAIVNSRKWVPIVVGVIGVAAIGAAAFVILRKRRRTQDDAD